MNFYLNNPELTPGDLGTTAAELRSISRGIRTLQANVRTLEVERAELIQHAIAAGWTHAQIAEATGLTRGRIGQIAQHPA